MKSKVIFKLADKCKLNVLWSKKLIKVDKMNLKQCIFSAFTLAEVLLTMTIVGIVAALTITVLIPGIQYQIMLNRLKEGYNEITQATKLIAFNNNGTMINSYSTYTDLKNNYEKYLNYSQDCNSGLGVCWPSNIIFANGNGPVNSYWGSATNTPSIILNNRLIITFSGDDAGPSCNSNWSNYYPSNTVCYLVFLDVTGINGTKIWGTDIFGFWVLSDSSVVPNGINGDYFSPATTGCSTGSGQGCTKLYLWGQ